MGDTETLLQRLRAYKEFDAMPSEDALAKWEVADQLRALSHAITKSGASAEQMREIAAQLRSQRDLLGAPNPAGEAAGSPALAAAVPGMEDFRDRSPVTGPANPMAPPATLSADLEAQVVTGEVIFGPAFEGAPGCVHGGFVSALLDEALGMTCIFSGGPAMTAELVTRYRHHTPVATPLRVEARMVSVEGRKIRAAGEVYHGDLALVEASGLFIAVDSQKFARLAAARSQRELD